MSKFFKSPRFMIFTILMAGILLFLAQCGFLGFTYDWRHKIVVSVQTPSGVVSGGSVHQLHAAPIFTVKGSNSHGVGLRGEAVVVALPNGQYLFALLPSDKIENHSAALYGDELKAMGAKGINGSLLASFDLSWIKRMKDLAGLSPRPIARKYQPMLVTFTDVNNPASVKLVDPNDLDAAFGCPSSVAGQASEASASPQTDADPKRSADDKPCYALKSITLEITDEPVTKGKVAEAIPCVKAGRGCNWHNLGLPYSNPLSHLNGAFLRNSK